MTKNVFCLGSEVTVKEAIRIFVEKKISGAPVILTKTGILLSLISEADLIRFAAMDGLNYPIYNFLEKLPKFVDLITVRANDSFGELFKKFLIKPVRRVLVVSDDGRVLGIVSRRDIMTAFVRESDND
jgi:CBS domain-containing protein